MTPAAQPPRTCARHSKVASTLQSPPALQKFTIGWRMVVWQVLRFRGFCAAQRHPAMPAPQFCKKGTAASIKPTGFVPKQLPGAGGQSASDLLNRNPNACGQRRARSLAICSESWRIAIAWAAAIPVRPLCASGVSILKLWAMPFKVRASPAM
jgi:hypothetical protein